MPRAPPVLCVVGPPKAAKSELITRLVEAFAARGLRVGVAKRHAHPGFEVDREGKDSRRYYQAGATGVVISAPDMLAFISRRDREMPLEEVVERFFAYADLVLADGYARSPAPRIIVCSTPQDERTFGGECEVVALVDASDGRAPGAWRDAVLDGLVEAVRQRFGL